MQKENVPQGKDKSDYERLYPKRNDPYYYVLNQIRLYIEDFINRYSNKNEVRNIVDMGCGSMPYRPLLESQTCKYIGVDIPENEYADACVLANGRVDLEDAIADMVFSTQVLEHVADPKLYLSECNRILKESGIVLLSTHGIWEYHPVPTDYWRWTGPGLVKIVEESGFKVIEIKGVMNIAATSIQLLQIPIAEKFIPSYKLKKLFFAFMQTLISVFDKVFNDKKNFEACVFVLLAKKKS